MAIVPITLTAGETRLLTLTVTDDDLAVDLTGATVELEAKEVPGAEDPPLIEKALGSGITLLPQSGDTVGKAEIEFASDDTAELGGRRLYYDVVVVTALGRRYYVIDPSPLNIRQPVNLP